MPDSYTPPQEVQNNARRGLELRQEFNRGGTAVGVARARDLSNGKGISPDTINRMISYFARHEVDKQGEGWADQSNPSAGYIAWLLWGGDAGRTWAEKVKRQMEKDIEKQKDDFSIYIPISKMDDDLEGAWGVIVLIIGILITGWIFGFGWGLVNKINGELFEDSQGDLVEDYELEKAVYDFMLVPKHDEMHKRIVPTSKVVESFVVTDEKLSKMFPGESIPQGKRGWWIGIKIYDKEIYKKHQTGEYSGFSITGSAQRREV